MAEEINLQVNVDKGNSEASLKSLEDQVESFAQKNEKLFESFTKAGTIITGFAVAGAASIYGLAQGAMEGQTAMAQLNHAIIDVSGGTEETVKAFEALAVQLQANGVLNKDAIITGQAQLSTFGLSTDAVYNLTASMADLAVNQFGVSATGDQLTQTANMMQKALQGQFGVLEKSGIRFTEAQQEMILYGTEMEKVTAINEGFAQNLKFTNEVAMQTMAGQLENLKNKFGEAIGPLEDAMLPALQKLAEILSSVADWLASLDPATLEMAGTVLVFATAIAAVVGPLLLLIGMLPTLAAGFAILTGPVGLVLLAITAVTAAVILAIKYWDEIKVAVLDFLTSIYEKAPATFNLIYQVITFVMEGIWASIKGTLDIVWAIVVFVFDALVAYFTFVWNVISTIFDFALLLIESIVTGNFDTIKEYLTVVWEGIKVFFGVIWEGIKGVFVQYLTFIKTFWITVWEGIKSFFITIWEAMKNFVVAAFDFWIGIINFYLEPFKQAFQFLWDAVGGVITSATSGITDTVKSMLNFIISAVNTAIGGINSISAAASKLPGVKIPTLPTIPMLAEGGIVTGPTTAVIGEAGPEAVIPLSKMGRYGGGGEMHFHFEGPVSSKEVAMEYADMIVKELMLDGKVV